MPDEKYLYVVLEDNGTNDYRTMQIKKFAFSKAWIKSWCAMYEPELIAESYTLRGFRRTTNKWAKANPRECIWVDSHCEGCLRWDELFAVFDTYDRDLGCEVCSRQAVAYRYFIHFNFEHFMRTK